VKRNYIFLAIAAIILGAAASFWVPGKPLTYKEMPGYYQCEDFGLPDKTFSKLQITDEMRLIGHSATQQFPVGRLAPRDSGAELEYSMEVVHFSSFGLDPFTAPRLMAYKRYLTLAARTPEKEFTVKCERLNFD